MNDLISLLVRSSCTYNEQVVFILFYLFIYLFIYFFWGGGIRSSIKFYTISESAGGGGRVAVSEATECL